MTGWMCCCVLRALDLCRRFVALAHQGIMYMLLQTVVFGIAACCLDGEA